jgi:hypothetical protein
MERCGDDASPFDRRLIAPMIREPADRHLVQATRRHLQAPRRGLRIAIGANDAGPEAHSPQARVA